MKKIKKFDQGVLDDFLEATDRAVQICSIHEQASNARQRADEEETPLSEEIEEELVSDYLEKVTELAELLDVLSGKVPFESLKKLLDKLPHEVHKDVLELQKASA